MKINFKYFAATAVLLVTADILVNSKLPYHRDDMPFVVRSLVVDGVDISNSDEADAELEDEIAYSKIMSNVVYDQLAA